jgi:predicted dehydrogenase
VTKNRVRVAVIGTGRWGLEHSRVFATHGDSVLCGVAGRNPERTHARAALFGVKGYTDVDTMMSREKPDLVSVCLPTRATSP